MCAYLWVNENQNVSRQLVHYDSFNFLLDNQSWIFCIARCLAHWCGSQRRCGAIQKKRTVWQSLAKPGLGAVCSSKNHVTLSHRFLILGAASLRKMPVRKLRTHLLQYLWVNENACTPMSQWKTDGFSAACPLWLLSCLWFLLSFVAARRPENQSGIFCKA